MTYQVDIADGLDAHDAGKLSVDLATREGNAGRDLCSQLVGWYIGLMLAVGRDDASVDLRCIVDDRQHSVSLVRSARPNGRLLHHVQVCGHIPNPYRLIAAVAMPAVINTPPPTRCVQRRTRETRTNPDAWDAVSA